VRRAPQQHEEGDRPVPTGDASGPTATVGTPAAAAT
jgi:hypothetical protein